MSELVIAVISRAFPDVEAQWTPELQSLLKGVSNNAADALRELEVPRAKAKLAANRLGLGDVGFLNLEGRIVSAHLKAFSAKFAFAFHFFATGRAVPVGGGVVSMAYSNTSLLDGKAPDDFIAHFGAPNTLVQGMKHVGEQFRYAVQATEEGDMTMAFASFRQSFAIATFSSENADKLKVDDEMPHTFVGPGGLKVPVPKPEFISVSTVFPAR